MPSLAIPLQVPGVHAELAVPEQPRAVVQVVHGMAEHSGRYLEVRDHLLAAGFGVVLSDHRGHGRSPGTRFHLADRGGWGQTLADLRAVGDAARARTGGLPTVLLGHSMGSYLAREYVARWGTGLAAVVLSGCGGPLTTRDRAGRAAALAQVAVLGPQHRAHALSAATYATFNRGLGRRTRFEWLSRDRERVDAYVVDPGCGGDVTARFLADLLGGISTSVAATGWWPRGLPTLLVSGDRDPVGGHGRAPRGLAARLRSAGVRDVALHLVPGARHEPFQELEREETLAVLTRWLAAHLPR